MRFAVDLVLLYALAAAGAVKLWRTGRRFAPVVVAAVAACSRLPRFAEFGQ